MMLKTITKIIINPILIFLWIYGCSMTETKTNSHLVPREYPSCAAGKTEFSHLILSFQKSFNEATLSDCKETQKSEGYNLKITFTTVPREIDFSFLPYDKTDWKSFLESDDKATIEVSTSWPKFEMDFNKIKKGSNCPIVETDETQKDYKYKWTFNHNCDDSVIKNYEDKFKENSKTSSDRYEVSK